MHGQIALLPDSTRGVALNRAALVFENCLVVEGWLDLSYTASTRGRAAS